MSTVTLEMRVAALERTVRTLRRPTSVARVLTPKTQSVPVSTKKPKKLSRWLQEGLDDIAEGRVSGPFHTVDELTAHLQS